MAGSQHEVETLNRILQLDWQGGDPNKQPSQLALFSEFLRRMGVWCVALGWHDAHPIASDLPARLVPDVRATPVNATLMQQTLRTLGKTSVYERMLLTNVLNWAAVAGFEAVQAYDLPDPYEPVLWFYERGGWLDKAEGDSAWEISGVIKRIDKAHVYHDDAPLPLDETLLDEIDSGISA
jgi:hypothetical protein